MRTVFIDVDTQYDFLLPSGALYVSGAETVLPVITRLNRFALAQSIPVISTVDCHSEDDPEFRDWPGHCIAKTFGQRKPDETLLEWRFQIPNLPGTLDYPPAQQYVVQKQHVNAFTNAHLSKLLAILGADRYVVYGVVTEICVRHAALGLLETGKRVELIEDAVRSLSAQASAEFVSQFTSSGGVLTHSNRVLG